MPSWIGPWEIMIVVIIALLIFGPRKLPELGSSLGKSIRGFRKGLKESQEEIQSTVADVRQATGVDEVKAAVTEVREAAGLDEVKSAMAEVRQAASLDEVKSAVAEVRQAVDVKAEVKDALSLKPINTGTATGTDTIRPE